jgi:hypothetical protein
MWSMASTKGVMYTENWAGPAEALRAILVTGPVWMVSYANPLSAGKFFVSGA